MANLIITIIAIALIALMAMAAIWYGSSSFNNAQAKARASTLITQAQQIAGAIRYWSANNAGGIDPLGDISRGPSCVEISTATAPPILSTAYLASVPTPINVIEDMGAPFDSNWIYTNEHTPIDTLDCTGIVSSAGRRYLLVFLNGDPGVRICQHIVASVYGAGSDPATVTTMGDFSTMTDYSCGSIDADTNVFVMRVY